MYPQILFGNRKPDRITTLSEYRQNGGYQGLEKAVKESRSEEVRQIIFDAVLRGRGGAAFPMGSKMTTVPDNAPYPRYVVCNADEMEPGTFKDRVLIHADPHQLIEGMALAGYGIGAEKGIIFIRPEYEGAARILEREIDLAKEKGFIGKGVFGSGFSFDLNVHRSGGRYICGEGTALLNALSGNRPNPKKPPPHPTEIGLWGQPTLLQNVETLSCVPHVVRHGAEWFKSLALTPGSAGTKIFCVSGKVNRPGCYELPMGVKLSEVIETHAGGMLPGSTFKACLPGGASTAYITEKFYHIEMDYDTLKKAGHRLGTAAVMVFDQQTCMVGATLNLVEFFSRESCGWCTPCREGIPFIRDLLYRIETGQGERSFMTMITTMCRHLWNAYCAFAPGAATVVESLFKEFEDEVVAHIEEKRCPFKDKQ